MKYLNKQFYKNKEGTLLTVLCSTLLLLVFSCVDNDKIIYGINDEAIAPVGFSDKSLDVEEAGEPAIFEVRASKKIFDDGTFEITVLDGDDSDVIITDLEGNVGPNFTIKNGTDGITLQAEAVDNPIYEGKKTITYLVSNLVGEGIYITDTSYSSRGRLVTPQFKLTIIDDEPVPPLVGFAEAESETSENLGTHNVSINISEATPSNETFKIDFSGTAVVGDDYTVSGLVDGVLDVTLNAGETEVIVPIVLIDDDLVEDNKTIIMDINTISSGLYPGDFVTHTVTIVENDIPTETKEIFATDASMIKGGSSGDDQFGGNNLEMSNKLPDTKNTRSGIMKFDITGIDASKVMSAKVVLTTYNEEDASRWKTTEDVVGGVVPQTLHYVSDDSWSQSAVTWNSTPDLDKDAGRFVNPAIVTFVPPFLVGTSGLTGIKHEFDITSQLQTAEPDNILSLGIEVVPFTNGKRIYYRGKKDTSEDPKLIIVVRTD